MSIKEFLNQAFEVNRFITAKQEELAELRERAKYVPTIDLTRERVQGGEHSDRVANTAAAIVDLERAIQSDLECYFEVKREIYDVIESVDKPKLKLILQLRYANFKKWEQIQEAIEITDLRYLFRLHNAALEEAKKTAPNRGDFLVLSCYLRGGFKSFLLVRRGLNTLNSWAFSGLPN